MVRPARTTALSRNSVRVAGSRFTPLTSDRISPATVVTAFAAAARLDGISGEETLVARIGGGGFFGEMSLLTGEPRTASVIADTETEVLVLSKSDFSSIISSDAGAVEALSNALVERMQALAERTAEADAGARTARAPQRADLIRRIRGCFGL